MGIIKRKPIFYCIFFALQFGAMELAMRGYYAIRSPTKVALSRVDALTGYALVPGYTSSNPKETITSEGFRITHPPVQNGDNIVMMGESTTYGTGVNDEETLPYYLEDILRNDCNTKINVKNLGLPGSHTNHHVARFKRDVVPLQPKVVVFFLNVNDFAVFWFQDMRRRERDYATLSAVFDNMAEPPQPSMAIFRAVSNITRKLSYALSNSSEQPFWHYISTQEALEWEADEAIYSHFEANMMKLVTLSQAIDATPVFVIPPVLLKSPQTLEAIASSPKQIFALPNKEVKYWYRAMIRCRPKQLALYENLAQKGLQFVDLRGIFEKYLAADVTALAEVSLDGLHFSAQGNAIFAQNLARELIEKGYVSCPVRVTR